MGENEGKAQEKPNSEAELFGGWDFKIGGNIVPIVKEIPVKSLGRHYTIPLTDRHKSTEVQKVVLKGLILIDRTYLPVKMKAWCYQYSLQPRFLWLLQMDEISRACWFGHSPTKADLRP